MINIYCDESCHLEISDKNKDKQKSMVLGGIICPEESKKAIINDIRKIKVAYGLSKYGEFKWTKVSNNKIEFYVEIIKYFFRNNQLGFRALVFKNKSEFYYNYYSHNDLYYLAYYLLLREMISTDTENSIYIDKKDTRGGSKIKELRENLLTNKLTNRNVDISEMEFNHDLIKRIQIIDSRDTELMQLADLLIGAIAYINRIEEGEKLVSPAKMKIVNLIKDESGYSLIKSTLRQEKKLNIFIWCPNKRGHI